MRAALWNDSCRELQVCDVYDLTSGGVVGGRTSLVVDALPLPVVGSRLLVDLALAQKGDARAGE